MPELGPGHSLLLQGLDNAGFAPAHLGREVAQNAELPVVLELDDLEGVRHNLPLLNCVSLRHSFEDL